MAACFNPMNEPSNTNLPTAKDINPTPGNLDEEWALQKFLGKNLAQAEELFREASLNRTEDLTHMGPSAFRFYVQAAINYIRSDACVRDSDMINGFAGTLEHRLEWEGAELIPIADPLAFICGYIVEHYDRFEINPDIYGDLRPCYLHLQQAFAQSEKMRDFKPLPERQMRINRVLLLIKAACFAVILIVTLSIGFGIFQLLTK